jgi:hypothetical protein
MANYSSTPTLRANYTGLGMNGKQYSFREVTITLSSMGTATNNIPASAFDLTKISGCSNAVKSDNSVVLPASPSANGSLLLLGGGSSNAPADYSGDFLITVWGPLA